MPLDDKGPSRPDLDISIVMPCLNEEESVADCVRQALAGIEKAKLQGEVIIVDNGSTDRSAELAAAAGARVVQHPEKGYGQALRRGFREARGRYVMMGDCDGTYEFGELAPMLAPLQDGYEMVIGNRLVNPAPGAMPWVHRFIGTPLISFVLRFFTGARIRDSQCGIRAMKKEALDRLELRSPGMELASEMILKAMRKGVRMAEVPVPYYARAGESKLSTLRDGWRHIKFLLTSSPSYVFIGPGVLFTVLGLIALGVTVFTTSGVTVGSVRWQPIYAAGIFLVIGVNAIMLGVCSKLLAVRDRLQEEDWVVRCYRRYLGLGRVLVAALILGLAGLGIDVYIFVRWLGDADKSFVPEAAVAQSFIVLGANLIFASLAAAMIDDRTWS